ncbi:hypothetical protein D7X74_21250 [Corallococcus sp. CA047B]|uniref:hypothetical protein n=1 Tax=Corallococcus sp. CA047B TaxID=2316729 RepID=UPI000EA0318D|nr:hypothetical protein [Corallococcus sp. CA047B]RKH13777.1 hypothetical protein D7X74_21250 [Corallococcus sp. CA047B]
MPSLSRLSALALVCLAFASPAFASLPPLTGASEIPGLRQPFSGITFNNSKRVLDNLVRAFGKRVGVSSGTPMTEHDVQCGLAKLGAGFVQELMLNTPPGFAADDLAGLPDALAHYRALEEQWCRPPPGAPTNKGAELVKLFIIRNTEGVPQARAMTEKYTARAAKLDGPTFTARDVAIAVAVGLAILAKEALPLPVP